MSEPYIGQIQIFGCNFSVRGWAQCQGQLLPISSNQALFSLLGTTYGGDGRSTFALPDLRGRSIVGVGSGPGLNPIRLGTSGGSNSHSLTVAEMPEHNHLVQVNSDTADEKVSSDKYLAATSAKTYSKSNDGGTLGQTVTTTGNDEPLSIVAVLS
jgi:microcystin-dependent protein